MKKINIRGWEIVVQKSGINKPHKIFVPATMGHMGFILITCLKCGHVIAGSIVNDAYGTPIAEKVKGIICSNCNTPLEHNYAEYPNVYIVNRVKYTFDIESVPLDDDDSIRKEFEDIYSI
jgi:hypothetical protein